jgi:hypothetical protein
MKFNVNNINQNLYNIFDKGPSLEIRQQPLTKDTESVPSQGARPDDGTVKSL